MKSALEQLDAIDKRNGIKDAHKRSNDGLLVYVQTQIDEMQAILQRLRVDVLLNECISVDGKSEEEARDDKVRKLEKDMAQMAEAIDVLTKLRDELES